MATGASVLDELPTACARCWAAPSTSTLVGSTGYMCYLPVFQSGSTRCLFPICGTWGPCPLGTGQVAVMVVVLLVAVLIPASQLHITTYIGKLFISCSQAFVLSLHKLPQEERCCCLASQAASISRTSLDSAEGVTSSCCSRHFSTICCPFSGDCFSHSALCHMFFIHRCLHCQNVCA